MNKSIIVVGMVLLLVVGCAKSPDITCNRSAQDALSAYGQPASSTMETLEDGRLNTGTLVYSQYGFTIHYSVDDPDNGYCEVNTVIDDKTTFCGTCSTFSVGLFDFCDQFPAQTAPTC